MGLAYNNFVLVQKSVDKPKLRGTCPQGCALTRMRFVMGHSSAFERLFEHVQLLVELGVLLAFA